MTTQELQSKLKKVLNTSLSVDGDYGKSTTAAVVTFQKLYGLTPDGQAGPKTQAKLNEVYALMFQNNSKLLNFGKPRFAVFVDAGHWGIDDSGNYDKIGKFYKHEGAEVHERGYFYEGYENRLAAEAFCEALVDNGIMPIRIYHPHKEVMLSDRANIVKSYLRRGYYGYLHSFHSNAIDIKNNKEKLDSTIGFECYTTGGNTLSDKIAEKHYQIVSKNLGATWRIRTEKSDGDSDREANFQILRETDLSEFQQFFGSILEEFGFYTSFNDTKFIIDPKIREQRVASALELALWVKNDLIKMAA